MEEVGYGHGPAAEGHVELRRGTREDVVRRNGHGEGSAHAEAWAGERAGDGQVEGEVRGGRKRDDRANAAEPVERNLGGQRTDGAGNLCACRSSQNNGVLGRL